jgi:5-methylcytosine-specific restriction enzyme B
VTFHPSYAYEDFVEGFRPVPAEAGGLTVDLRPGLFKQVCEAAAADPGSPYVVIIDEINRGNVSKILGELVTLLEKDKRGLHVTLPQSGEQFFVPANVYLIATMNTADRSIRLLDAALRRRFAFIEILPDPDVLKGAAVGSLALDTFLVTLNQRLIRHAGRERQIAHSYFMVGDDAVATEEEFAERFLDEVVPQLQEYAYDDYRVLSQIIGEKLVDLETLTLSSAVLDPTTLVQELAAEFSTIADPDEG